MDQAMEDLASTFPKPSGTTFAYGTAGFRALGSILDSTCARAGVLAGLRSLRLSQSADASQAGPTSAAEAADVARRDQDLGAVSTGLMITASHNPARDNGVKLADRNGGMLDVSWEGYAEQLANAPDGQGLSETVRHLVQAEAICVAPPAQGRVFLARDTRESGQRLLAAAVEGVRSVPGVEAVLCGELTTPQLHWLVRAANLHWLLPMPHQQPRLKTEEDYYGELAAGFHVLLDPFGPLPANSGTPLAQAATEQSHLLVDGANGVGAKKLPPLLAALEGGERGSSSGIRATIRNCGGADGELNNGVGADFVQKEQKAPQHFSPDADLGSRCVSFDGDADRLVYFYWTPSASAGASPAFHLLDGDKISSLFVLFLKDQLQLLSASPACQGSEAAPAFDLPGYGRAVLGAVQTAYANGASTRFLTGSLGVPVACTKTGVKHLHPKAEDFDIGVYFEANGHGTALFQPRLLQWLNDTWTKVKAAPPGSDSPFLPGPQASALGRLWAASQVLNQAVGDALSNMLLVEACLRLKGWGCRDWDALYTDCPCRQLKVQVKDRSVITTTDAERRVVSPAGLQPAIDDAVSAVEMGRSFVRPSGTEDVVRVYAEAATQELADSLANQVAGLVRKWANGA